MSCITYEVRVYRYYTEWRLNGKLHREDGPAVEYACGEKHWYLNGKQHRADGPASEYADGTKLWYLHGIYHPTKAKYYAALNNCDGKVVEIDGKKYRCCGNKVRIIDGSVVTIDGQQYRLVAV